VACALATVGMLLDLKMVRANPSIPAWPHLATAALGATLLGVMLAGKRTRGFTALAFVAINVAMSVVFWISDNHLAVEVRDWQPFRPYQIGVLLVAVLAPSPVWAGVSSILVFTVVPLVHLALFSPATRAHLPANVPWVMMAYGISAMTMLIYRLRHLAAERALVRASTEAAALHRLARSFLALRDLANTPLQTLALGLRLLRERENGNEYPGPPTDVVLDRMRRALERLRESHRLLSGYDSHLRWDAADESFDPVEILRGTAPPPKL
jgi:hypothetical protein